MKTIKTIKNLVLLTSTCVAVLLAAGCDKEKEEIEEIIEGKWKLAGIIDTETGELLRELEPKDCEECYTLTFDTEYTAIAHSINVRTMLNLLNLPAILYEEIYLPTIAVVEVYDKDGKNYTAEGDTFHRMIYMTTSCEVTFDELKLYTAYGFDSVRCNPDTYYLLFKPFKIKKQ